MDDMLSFGQWLKESRRANGLTQNQFAKQVYCATVMIRKIEADRLRPSRELVALIANALNVEHTEHSTIVEWARRRRSG